MRSFAWSSSWRLFCCACIWRSPTYHEGHELAGVLRNVCHKGGRRGGHRESDGVSKELKRQGFTFVGTTICYAFMQAVGMVNDYNVECFRWQELHLPAQ